MTQRRSSAGDGVWAVGDCALIPMPGGEPCPPTAQHAIRQAKVLAAQHRRRPTGAPRRSFAFKGLGKLGALGHHRAVAELPGGLRVAGLPAWLMWRSIYWAKLPGRQPPNARRDLLAERPLPAGPSRPAEPRRRPRRDPGPLRAWRDGVQRGRRRRQPLHDPRRSGAGTQALRVRARSDRRARSGRVLRRDGAPRTPAAQRHHARAHSARPARPPGL